MMPIEWSPSAVRDLASLVAYFQAQKNDELAQDTARRIIRAVKTLQKLPDRGRPSHWPDTREFLIPKLPYRVYYTHSQDQSLTVLRLLHQHQQQPECI